MLYPTFDSLGPFATSSNSGPFHYSGAGASGSDGITKALSGFADAVYRLGITATGMLPFSSRGIVFNAARASLLIPLRLIQNAGPQFFQKMKASIAKDWNQGISGFSVDLESPKNKQLCQEAVKENFRYAAYMYLGFCRQKNGGEEGILLSCPARGDMPKIPEAYANTLQSIDRKLKEMGFQVDEWGNYYNKQTGSMFNLIFDKEKKEVIVGFMGLGNHNLLEIDPREKSQVGKEMVKGAAADWLGGIPPSARQAIEIGRMLKETTAGTEITPVMVGHSHGGGLAQTGAVANGIKAVVFNPRPIGAGTRRYIGQSVIAENADKVTVFSGKGDWLTGMKVVNALASIFERLTGIMVPRSVGTTYLLPKIPKENMAKQHVEFYRSFALLKDETART